jgi:hypothetical protein
MTRNIEQYNPGERSGQRNVLDLPKGGHHFRDEMDNAISHRLVFRYEAFEKESNKTLGEARSGRVVIIIVLWLIFAFFYD